MGREEWNVVCFIWFRRIEWDWWVLVGFFFFRINFEKYS